MSIKKTTDSHSNGRSPMGKGNGKKLSVLSFPRFCAETRKKRNFQLTVFRRTAYIRSLKKLWTEFKGRVIAGVMTATIMIAVCFTVNAFHLGLGYEVLVDGKYVGLVDDKSVAYEAVEEATKVVKKYLGETEDFEKTPAFARRIVAGRFLSDMDDIRSELLSDVDKLMEGYTITIDGETVLGLSSKEESEQLLAQYKQRFLGDNISEDMSVDFCENLEVKRDFFHISLLETTEEALKTLSDGRMELVQYTVQKGESMKTIAEKFGTTIEHILALNKNITDSFGEGSQVNVEKRVPLLSVRSVQTLAMTETVPFEIEQIKDASSYEGNVEITQKGKVGSEKIIARVTKINGVETQKDVLERETLEQPVKQIEKVGTKVRPASTGTGAFVNPTYGVLSSRYGSRWGKNHNGIDIAGAHNSDIKAADGGVVTYAGWMSGYGNYVTIDHENGYQTSYAHCDSLCVSVGARVSKGEVIAKMGNTGRSTGTHLHFEVKKNGAYVNPLEFVTY